ncbi:MAG TPA: DUF2797 domain-containing protein, partial [Candidatus Saccharimonadales bacterium]|nr:DUF2797 domain-containing protein [Candidatus Saccharimonadales bacterium]
MPETGTYLLTSTGFNGEQKPYIELQRSGSFTDLLPYQKTITLQFDMSQRYCIGWRDITKGERFSCPDSNKVEGKYEECAACQKRTGFNPAFYHASNVSEQQQARNNESHVLYLAHFGPDIIKVGISHAARGNSRLLEQGARSALVLDTFASAHIARQHEARIALLEGIIETVQLRKKIALMEQPYNEAAALAELLKTRQAIEQQLDLSFSQNQPTCFNSIYFPLASPNFSEAYDCS